MVKNLMDRLPLNDGYTIPGIGFGTSGISNDNAEELVFMAIMRGYRLIDTASWYKNEEGVGKGIKKAVNAGISREDIFVVSKVWQDEMGYHEATEAFNRSYERLGLDYIDLYLIHWPSSEQGKNLDTWKALEELKDSGRVRSIGVSNFNRGELNELLKEGRIKPSVNQVPVNPENANVDLDDFCYSNNIVIIGYSPLGAGKVNKDKKLASIGNKYYKSPAQIALKWSMERDVVPIPKTSNAERMVENLELFDFELTDEDHDMIDSIDQKNTSSKKRKDDNQGRRHGSRKK